MDFFTDRIAERLGGQAFGAKTELYKFERIKRAKEEGRKKHAGVPLLDLGVGEPDTPASAGIVRVLAREAGKPENRWYSDNGIPEFRATAVRCSIESSE